MTADIGPFIQDEGRIHYGDDAASFTVSRELFPVEVIARFTLDGEPVSKSRARFTKRGSKTFAYTPERTKVAEQSVAWKFRQAAPRHDAEAECEYGIVGVFFYAHRQRRDVDNMIKLLCDGLNGVAWADDSQVKEISGRKTRVLLKEQARTEVLVYRLGKIDKPTAPCGNCGEPMDIYESTKGIRKFCSQACHLEWRRRGRARECPECGTLMDDAKRGSERYCSQECYDTMRARENRTDLTCTECGSVFRGWRSMGRRKNIWCSDECATTYYSRRATFCVKGHRWSEFGRIKSNGKRYCRECNRIRVAVRKKATS